MNAYELLDLLNRNGAILEVDGAAGGTADGGAAGGAAGGAVGGPDGGAGEGVSANGGATLRCKAPRGVLTPELRAALKEHRRQLIAILTGTDGADGGAGDRIERRPAPDAPVPLSFSQRQLWFLDQLAPGNPVYNNPLAIGITGALDVAALGRALAEVVRRHEALRTVFEDGPDDEPRQVVRPAASVAVPLALVDLAGLPRAQRLARADEDTAADARAPFDLAAGPLLRARLIRLAEREHRLLLNVHHIVADGWSIGLLVRELTVLYGAYAQGRPAGGQPLPEPAVQYPDYALWQQRRAGGGALDRQLGHWTGRLAGAPTLLALPTDRPRPAVQRFRGDLTTVTVGAEVTRGLRAVSRDGEATLFMTLTAALSVLLWRYSGQDDVCVGTPFANRDRAEVEDLIGHFVNTLVIRTRLDPRRPFAELLREVRAEVLAAYAHADLPFDRLVEALKPERHTSHSPLFQVMLAVQNMPRGRLDLPGLTMRPVPTSTRAAKFDLAVEVAETGDGLTIAFEYDTDLFDATTVARMAGHYVRLLGQVAADPSRPVGGLHLLGPDERRRELYGCNATGRAFAGPPNLVDRFEAVARERPDQAAVVCGGVTAGYATVQRRANRLAHALLARGVRPDQVVGLHAGRTAELVVGILGILKAGAAYLPLEPALPAERLAQLVADAAPAVVLSDAAEPPAGWQAMAALEAQGRRDDPPGVTPHPDNLAYVIYTSGSTGRPKGVAVAHRSVTNLLDHWTQRLGALPGEPAALWSSFGFDVSVQEILLPLTTGGVLHVVPEDLRADPDALMGWLREHRIAQAYLPPAFVRWIEEAPAERLAGLALRQLLVGVEPLSENGLHRIRELLPGLRILNGYGPTETAVYSTAYLDIRPLHRQCPIGRPLANTRLYLLDERLEPVPPGVTGEIHIGGAGLARGYLGRPDLTAERFLPDPFVAGERMYRTGDLARRLADGTVEYIGRRDDQVKLRGFRIEPAEVEAALLDLPGVHEAAVLVDRCAGEPRLVAGVGVDSADVAHPDGAGQDAAGQGGEDGADRGAADRGGEAPARPPADWREALAQRLPGYMIPALFVELPRLPQTVNGKLDREALLRLARDRAPVQVNQSSPRDQVELTLYQIWKRLLLHPASNGGAIGIRDSFFDVGGSSISAIKLSHAIRDAFGETLAVREILQHPTIEAQGARLRRGSPGRPPSNLIEFRPGRRRVVCVHPAGGTAFCYLSLAKVLPEDCGVYGIQSPGVNPGESFLPTVEAMAESYLRLVAALGDGPLVLTGLSYGGLVAYEMGRRLALAGRRDLSVVLLDTQGTDDPAVRAAIAPVGMAEFRDKLIKFNGMYPGIEDEQVEQYLHIYNHNRLTMRDYLAPPAPARLVLIQATAGRGDALLEEARAFWRRRAAGGDFAVQPMDCDHWEMLETSEVLRVTALLERELAAAAGRVASGQVARRLAASGQAAPGQVAEPTLAREA